MVWKILLELYELKIEVFDYAYLVKAFCHNGHNRPLNKTHCLSENIGQSDRYFHQRMCSKTKRVRHYQCSTQFDEYHRLHVEQFLENNLSFFSYSVLN